MLVAFRAMVGEAVQRWRTGRTGGQPRRHSAHPPPHRPALVRSLPRWAGHPPIHRRLTNSPPRPAPKPQESLEQTYLQRIGDRHEHHPH
jgi:hypothetical protein